MNLPIANIYLNIWKLLAHGIMKHVCHYPSQYQTEYSKTKKGGVAISWWIFKWIFDEKINLSTLKFELLGYTVWLLDLSNPNKVCLFTATYSQQGCIMYTGVSHFSQKRPLLASLTLILPTSPHETQLFYFSYQ